MEKEIKINLETATLSELEAVKDSIIRRLLQDAHKKTDLGALYDSHGSVHSKNSVQKVQIMDERFG